MRAHAADLAIWALLLGAVCVDGWFLPAYPRATAYVIPIVLAVHRWSPRAVGAMGGLAVGLYVLNAAHGAWPLSEALLSSGALLAVVYLAVTLSAQRRKTAGQAQETAEAHRRLQEALFVVAHELRNPLAILLGGTRVLRQGSGLRSEREERVLVAMEGAARRMDRLLGDLLDTAQIGAGRFVVHPARMDLVSLVQEIVAQQQATTARHRLTIEAPERLEGVWDRERLGQLLANLLSNAIKYSPGGGEVRVTVQERAGEVVVQVADQGIGIAPSAAARLFSPFTRLDQTSEVGGTGLGLYICRAIARAHGGRIWVESTVERGSTFSVALPLSLRVPAEDGTKSDPLFAPQTAGQTVMNVSAQRPTRLSAQTPRSGM